MLQVGNILPLSYDIFEKKITSRRNKEQQETFETFKKLSRTKLLIKLNNVGDILTSLLC